MNFTGIKIRSFSVLYLFLTHYFCRVRVLCILIVGKSSSTGLHECLVAIETHFKILDPPEDEEKR